MPLLTEKLGMRGNLRGMRGAAFAAVAAGLLAMGTAASAAYGEEANQTLRFCSDPTNMPFSSDNPQMPGLYNEIGSAIGAALHRPVTFHWYKSYFGQRTVRETMLARKCDAMIGLPPTKAFMGPAILFSQPIMDVHYALVAAKGTPIISLADLKGRKVAVQYETTPQNLLASHDEVSMHTVLSPDEGMKSLADGQVDVAFVWAPVAGWLNKTAYQGRYSIQEVSGPGLSGQVAIGFAKWSGALRDQVNAVLPGLKDTIIQLKAKYGLPDAKVVEFGENVSTGAPLVQKAATDAAAVPAATPAVAQANDGITPPPATPAMVKAGQTTFDGTCAHCHGTDAVQSDWHINLKLLHHRYGNDMYKVFWKTVHEGRVSKGMPSWQGVFTDTDFNNIFAFLSTLQKKDP